METTEHAGRVTAYRHVDRWDGPTVCFVHGSGGTHHVWAAQYGADDLALPAAAIDLSGHGDSADVDTEPGPATLDEYARDVAAVADAADADVLVGNSLGGAVVQHVVLEGFYDPAGIVLAGSGAKLAVLDSLREILTEDFEAVIDFLHEDDRLFHDADPEMVERSVEAMRAVGQAVTRRDFLTCHEFDVRDRLDEIAVPTLALCGEHDQLTPPKYHEYVAENVQHGSTEVIDDAAHLAMAEQPAAFNAALAEFCSSGQVA